MSDKFKPIDLSGVKTYSLADRKSKVSTGDFAKTWRKGSSYCEFLANLPDILAGEQLKSVISAIVKAYRTERTIIFGMGAHVIKVGLNPVVIDLMERGVITAVAMNGAGIIHDLELALVGQTSEDVAAAIEDGSFGMARETCAFIAEALAASADDKTGLGEAVGRLFADKRIDASFPIEVEQVTGAAVRIHRAKVICAVWRREIS